MSRRFSTTTTRVPFDGVVTFVRQVITNYQHTGAVLPSSSALARVMTRTLRNAPGAKRLLEVGPGTGPFTRHILNALRPGDELHIVEINPIFAARLDRIILEPYRRVHPDVTVQLHCGPIQSVPIEGPFDFIVCGLPFNNFSPAIVRTIFRRLFDLLAAGGELVYFEYAGVRVIKSPLVGRHGRRHLKQIEAMGKVLRRRHGGRRELVLRNVPPAVAVRLVR